MAIDLTISPYLPADSLSVHIFADDAVVAAEYMDETQILIILLSFYILTFQ